MTAYLTTVYCPRCGQPVQVRAAPKGVLIYSLDWLVVQMGDVRVEHRCGPHPPQDRPA